MLQFALNLASERFDLALTVQLLTSFGQLVPSPASQCCPSQPDLQVEWPQELGPEISRRDAFDLSRCELVTIGNRNVFVSLVARRVRMLADWLRGGGPQPPHKSWSKYLDLFALLSNTFLHHKLFLKGHLIRER